MKLEIRKQAMTDHYEYIVEWKNPSGELISNRFRYWSEAVKYIESFEQLL